MGVLIRHQKACQRLLFALSPLSRFSLSLGSFTSRAFDPHLHTGSREPRALVASGITGSGVRG
jgi:hypothetical protein